MKDALHRSSPNKPVELTAGSHSLAAAAHCQRWASEKPNGDDELE
jgi:hypothetical protein